MEKGKETEKERESKTAVGNNGQRERERERERTRELDARASRRTPALAGLPRADSIASELRVHADNELQVRVYYLHMTRIGVSAAAVILSRRYAAIRAAIPHRRCCTGNDTG